MINSKGFRCEKHIVKTKDGYILNIFRITSNKNCLDSSFLPPVLLQHGILDSSDGWTCNKEEKSIAFVLANNNFDVWLSNSRGNKYCKNHENLSINSSDFWNFSFHDLGKYDIPAVIEYIKTINKSGEKIIYFGHSQGCTLMFSGLIEKYDFYKNNIKLFVALAPVVRLNNLKSNLLKFIKKTSIHRILKKIGIYEILPYSKRKCNLLSYMQQNASSITNFFIKLISDSDSEKCNDKIALSKYLKIYPCGTSLKNLTHFIQIINSKKFQYYDYGKNINSQIYNYPTPPEYNLKKIKDIPIFIICGDKDKIANYDDVKWLYNEIQKNVIYYNVAHNIGHLSFLCCKDFSWFKTPLKIIIDNFYKNK